MKKLSCGVIFHDKEKFLIGHVTGKPHFDIPKGGKLDDKESNLDCAFREFLEETGYNLKVNVDAKLSTIGLCPYLPSKDLFLFDVRVETLPTIKTFFCNEKIRVRGRDIYEFDYFKYITLQETEKHLILALCKVMSHLYPKGF